MSKAYWLTVQTGLDCGYHTCVGLVMETLDMIFCDIETAFSCPSVAL